MELINCPRQVISSAISTYSQLTKNIIHFLVTCPQNPNDMQPYLEIIAHELLMLYWYGTHVTLPKSLGGETVNVKAMLLQWICDYRGYPKCFRYKQSPAYVGACYCCDIKGRSGPSTSVFVNGKPRRKIKTAIYPGAWRKLGNLSIADQRRRYHGSQLNGFSSGDRNMGDFTKKAAIYFRTNAKCADEALRNGVGPKNPSHPSVETGAC